MYRKCPVSVLNWFGYLFYFWENNCDTGKFLKKTYEEKHGKNLIFFIETKNNIKRILLIEIEI